MQWSNRTNLDMWRTTQDGLMSAVVTGYSGTVGKYYRVSFVLFYPWKNSPSRPVCPGHNKRHRAWST